MHLFGPITGKIYRRQEKYKEKIILTNFCGGGA
jgi:hypothetical protein